jgi:hypothetical protein
MAERERDLTIVTPGHKYAIPHLDGDGETVIQFVSRPPLHAPVEGILIQDLLRVIIDRLQILDRERPWAGNAESIHDLRVILARQEARALIEAVKQSKLQWPELLRVGENGHFDWKSLSG